MKVPAALVAEAAEYEVCPTCDVEFRENASSRSQGEVLFCSPTCLLAFNTCASQYEALPVHGPCPVCELEFHSAEPRVYCSLSCYKLSEDYEALCRDIAPVELPATRVKVQGEIQCLQCAVLYTPKEKVVGPGRANMFCSRICSRRYSALRFDRWAANPQTLAVVQGYDEYLSGDLLTCLVQGCGWKGHYLATHLNIYHGIPAAEFKRAAGFNASTPLSSLPMRRKMRAIHNQARTAETTERMRAGRDLRQKRRWAETGRSKNDRLADTRKNTKVLLTRLKDPVVVKNLRYSRDSGLFELREQLSTSAEHQKRGRRREELERREKTILLNPKVVEPVLPRSKKPPVSVTCEECRTIFTVTHSTVVKAAAEGRAVLCGPKCVYARDFRQWLTKQSPIRCLGCGKSATPRMAASGQQSAYCSESCREHRSSKLPRAKKNVLSCKDCGVEFLGTVRQTAKSQAGSAVYCTPSCRARATHRAKGNKLSRD